MPFAIAFAWHEEGQRFALPEGPLAESLGDSQGLNFAFPSGNILYSFGDCHQSGDQRLFTLLD